MPTIPMRRKLRNVALAWLMQITLALAFILVLYLTALYKRGG
jgi:hypothetical protein